MVAMDNVIMDERDTVVSSRLCFIV